MLEPEVVIEGFRYFSHRIRVGIKGYRNFGSDFEEILENTIEACWDKDKGYFKTSAGHYSEFWTRDFGLCVPHLVRLGHRERCAKTLRYALRIFSAHRRVATTISSRGKPFDFPAYAPDSLAYLVRALAVVDDKELVSEHRGFLNSMIAEFYESVIEEETGLVRKNRRFSSMKDYSIRSSSCYDNSMVAMLKSAIEKLGLDNPFEDYDYGELLAENFWKGDRFIDDLSGTLLATGDAQVFPFYSGAVRDKGKWKSCFSTIRKLNLDKPFPLRYSSSSRKEHDMIWLEWLVKGWERDTVWPMLAVPFFVVLERFNSPRLDSYMRQYKEIVEKHSSLLEVFTREGEPFKTFFYCADEGMLWAAAFLDIYRRRKKA